MPSAVLRHVKGEEIAKWAGNRLPVEPAADYRVMIEVTPEVDTQAIATLRQAQESAVAAGLDKMTMDEIQTEIDAFRRGE